MTREELHNLNHYQLEIIHKYCDDDLHELKKICNPIIRRKNDVFQKDYDDIYDPDYGDMLRVSFAEKMFGAAVRPLQTSNKKVSFDVFLKGNLQRSLWEWSRDKHRQKRANVLRQNGKVLTDENGMSIVLSNLSLDIEDDDTQKMYEKVESGFSIDEKIEDLSEKYSKKMEKYLSRLSNIQRKVLILKGEGYLQEEIEKKLNISSKLYNDSIASIRAWDNTQHIVCLLKRKGKR